MVIWKDDIFRIEFADSHYELRRMPQGDHRGHWPLVTKLEGEDLLVFLWSVGATLGKHSPQIDVREAIGLKANTQRERIFQYLQDKSERSRAEIGAALGLRQPRAQALLKDLMADGRIRRRAAGIRYLYSVIDE